MTMQWKIFVISTLYVCQVYSISSDDCSEHKNCKSCYNDPSKGCKWCGFKIAFFRKFYNSTLGDCIPADSNCGKNTDSLPQYIKELTEPEEKPHKEVVAYSSNVCTSSENRRISKKDEIDGLCEEDYEHPCFIQLRKESSERKAPACLVNFKCNELLQNVLAGESDVNRGASLKILKNDDIHIFINWSKLQVCPAKRFCTGCILEKSSQSCLWCRNAVERFLEISQIDKKKCEPDDNTCIDEKKSILNNNSVKEIKGKQCKDMYVPNDLIPKYVLDASSCEECEEKGGTYCRLEFEFYTQKAENNYVEAYKSGVCFPNKDVKCDAEFTSPLVVALNDTIVIDGNMQLHMEGKFYGQKMWSVECEDLKVKHNF